MLDHIRAEDEIRAAYNEFWDKVWYSRQRETEASEGAAAARQIEEKYGWENLCFDDPYQLGLVSGRMSALAWALGMEWDESLDT
jgi:hypothetical protein